MSDSDLINLVREMRTYQKKYFKTRDNNVLKYAKGLEEQVDHELFIRQTPDLFEVK